MKERRFGSAAKLFRRQARTGSHKRQALFLQAYALLQDGQHLHASRTFRRLIKSYPLLADYHRYHAALALYRGGWLWPALKMTKQVGATAVVAVNARLLRADILTALKRERSAADIWARYLGSRPDGERADDAHFFIAVSQIRKAATLRTPQARQALLAKALGHLKQVVIKYPYSPRMTEATAKIQQITTQLPHGTAQAALTSQELYVQSMVLFERHRNVSAERKFATLLARTDLPQNLICGASYHRAKSVFKQRQRARSIPLFRRSTVECRKAGNQNLLAKSIYNLGRAMIRSGQYQQAIAELATLERELPSHRLADDARLRASEAAVELNRPDQHRNLLASLVKRYPKGDMVGEALWRLAWQAYSEQNDTLALRHLETIIERGPNRAYFAAGQALYWKARILQRSGRRRAALQTYEQCIRQYPLSYYALSAFNRLRERFRRHYNRLRRELILPIGRHAGQWRFPESRVTRSPAFRRGLELARLGFGQMAGRELARAGLSTKAGTPTTKLWLAAVLYDGAHLWHRSHRVPRTVDRRYEQSYPLGENVRRWRIAYPSAYDRLVRSSSRRQGVPRALVRAVMREESAFSPKVESYANAIGLMQLIMPTARTAGSWHRLKIDRTTLQRPAINILLGATYLRFLMRSFRRTFPLAIAGYNAGHGAAYSWTQRFHNDDIDEFVEQIPYQQTRHYTKRVLASLFAYSALYEPPARRIPRVGLRIPRVPRPVFRSR